VDDDRETRELLGMALKTAGFEVRLASDGLDALEYLVRKLPDLIVLDLDMPRLNGPGFHAALQSNTRMRHIPVIVVTGFEGLCPLPVRAHLQKPVEIDDFVSTVRMALRTP
jgi:chemosensory pili system protein ChpA (sensor histidine kinase/response regulator)